MEIYAAVESTGGYENNWFSTLKGYQKVFNLKVARVNPAGVNFNRRAGLKRNVTDAISALSIAEYLINHPDNIKYDQDDKWKSLCRHWNFVEMQKQQRVQTINQLETILYSANPTLMRFKKDNLPNWLLELIIQCPTAETLAKARPEKLAKIPYLSLARAKTLVAEAKQSIASATDNNAEILVSQIARQIKSFDLNIKSQMQLIERDLTCPEIEILKTFKGIDTISAIGLLLEIETIERFPTVKGFSCYYGLHPKFKQSGDKVIGVRMSKQGSKNMRKILFNIAKGAITYNPLITAVYEKKLSHGMKKMAAIGVCMHKILRIIYGMLKNKQAYNLCDSSVQLCVSSFFVTRRFTEATRRFTEKDFKYPMSQAGMHLLNHRYRPGYGRHNHRRCGPLMAIICSLQPTYGGNLLFDGHIYGSSHLLLIL